MYRQSSPIFLQGHITYLQNKVNFAAKLVKIGGVWVFFNIFLINYEQNLLEILEFI